MSICGGFDMAKKTEYLAPTPENIPPDLKGLAQLARWRAVWKKDRCTKVPIDSKAEDPSTWTSFDAAWRKYQPGDCDGRVYEG